MRRILVLGGVVWLGLAVVVSCYSQNAASERALSKVSGRVVAMDWVASKLVIDTGGDELTLVVPGGLEIIKGTEKIGFADLNFNDEVVVEYYNNSFAGLRAVKIIVEI